MKTGTPLFVCKGCTTIAIEVREIEKDTTTITGTCPRCGDTEFTSTIELGYTRAFVDKDYRS